MNRAVAEVVRKWRETAAIWENEIARGAFHGSPVGGGKGNIQNWINWLRGCAVEIEEASQRMTLDEQVGANRLHVEGDAEFVAWAARTFHELVLMEQRRYEKDNGEREVAAQTQRRLAAIYEVRELLKRILNDFAKDL